MTKKEVISTSNVSEAPREELVFVTMKVSKVTKKELDKFKIYRRETYDDTIARLLEEIKNKRGDKK